MSRAIKFRAWAYTPYDGWRMRHVREYGGLAGFFCEHEDDPLMQFTGLKDKNGVEIYEGDYVDVSMSDGKGGTLPHMGAIVYDEKFGAFVTRNFGGNTLLHNHCLHTMKIVGNVHETPDLLEPAA